MSALQVAGALVATAAGLFLALSLRRRLLHRGGGTVDVSLRLRPSGNGRGWVLGVGRFDGDELQWYRVFSLSPRPRRTLSRRDLTVTAQRAPSGPEAYALLKGAVVMDCRSGSVKVELAMDPGAVTGFLAWLESHPAGPPLTA